MEDKRTMQCSIGSLALDFFPLANDRTARASLPTPSQTVVLTETGQYPQGKDLGFVQCDCTWKWTPEHMPCFRHRVELPWGWLWSQANRMAQATYGSAYSAGV